MILAAAPLRSRLRSIDAARAQRQTALIAALHQRAIDNAVLNIASAHADDQHAATNWVRFGAGDAAVLLAPLLVDGALARLTPGPAGPDPAAAATLLARIEPIIAAIEAVLGIDLLPTGFESSVAEDAIVLRIDAIAPGGTIRHSMIVAVPATGPVGRSLLRSSIPAAFGALRQRWTARLQGPPVRASRIATIGAGDLMLLGLSPLTTRIMLPGRARPAYGELDPIRRTIVLANDTLAPPDAPGEAAPPRPIDWDELRVPSVIEIDGGPISASDVAALSAGSILPVPGAVETVAVRVIAGGMLIGEGELVAVGEGFGVLFTSVVANHPTAD